MFSCVVFRRLATDRFGEGAVQGLPCLLPMGSRQGFVGLLPRPPEGSTNRSPPNVGPLLLRGTLEEPP